MILKQTLMSKLSKATEKTEYYVPSRFPSEDEWKAMMEDDEETTIVLMTWFLSNHADLIEPEDEESVAFARKCISRNVK